jgi:fatty acid-binding protein DegV
MKRKLMEEFKPKAIIVNHMGATIGTHAGKDSLIISF